MLVLHPTFATKIITNTKLVIKFKGVAHDWHRWSALLILYWHSSQMQKL